MKDLLLTILLFVYFSAEPLGQTTITLELKAFLEGPFSGVQMNTDLSQSGCIPISQPYNQPPWNYNGTEQVTVFPPGVVDWVLVELRQTIGDASMAFNENMIARQAAFILENGVISSTDGISPLTFNIPLIYDLFVVIYHRNHIPVLSAQELILNSGMCNYDFTQTENAAYGGNSAFKQLSPGIWGLVSSDGNADGQVNNLDKNIIWKPQSGLSGYQQGDFNLDGQVNNTDKINFWSPNTGRSSQLPGAWSCNFPITDIRDARVYNTVEIGDQCWMRENMNVGLKIPVQGEQTDNGIIEKYCYQNNIALCEEYGALYQWYEAMDYSTVPSSRGICPEGWHIPDDNEWCSLEYFLDPLIICDNNYLRGVDGGGKLKESGYSHWHYPNSGATNSSGFTALPAGLRYITGECMDLSWVGWFWSSTDTPAEAVIRFLRNDSAKIGRDVWGFREYGFSLRCVHD